MEYSYIIKLNNYYESRSCCWREATITEQTTIVGPEHGIPPHPWSVNFANMPFFEKRKNAVTVPFTQLRKPCTNCGASGRQICEDCRGYGNNECPICHGVQNTVRDDDDGQ